MSIRRIVVLYLQIILALILTFGTWAMLAWLATRA